MSGARIWRVTPDAEALAHAAAEQIVAAIAAGGERPAICLTGGSTPARAYALLADDIYASRIPWDRTHWFVGDERFVPLDDPLSNMGAARRLVLDGRAPADHVHAVQTSARDVQEAARLYAADLADFHGGAALDGATPLFDLMLLGVGPDGHVASLFPGQGAIEEKKAWAVGVPQAGQPPFVPRVTLTVPALVSCRRMLVMAAGDGKAEILSRIAAGEDLPANRVVRPDAVWLVDEAAAADLPVSRGPKLVLVMGVSGAGKTTIGEALAARLGWTFLDADDLHSPESKAKMRAGVPLTDADRAPWLDALASAIARRGQSGENVVVACSALKKAFRDRLLADHPASRTVFLRGAPQLIADRLHERKGHFMSPDLLGDQLHTLEEPTAAEGALVVDVAQGVDAEVETIVDRLGPFAGPVSR